MQTFNLIDELESEDKFRKDIKYSRQLPEMFMTDDSNAQTENVTYSILGELRDRYKENESVTFTFQELAELGGLFIKRKTGKIDLYSGKKLDQAMLLVSMALKNFAYYRVTETNEDGTPKSWDIIPLFSKVSIDGSRRLAHLTISTEEIDPYQVDSKGNIIDKPLRVYDLINSSDWRTVKHLQFNREIHYSFVSKYTKRIYRFLSEFRAFPKGTKMRIDDFDKKILKIWLPRSEALDPKSVYDYRDNRKKFLDRAMKEIRELKTPDGNQIVRNLDYVFYKSGKSISAIEFVFTPFKDDLAGGKQLVVNSHTSSGKVSPFLKDAKSVLNYLNYLWSIDFKVSESELLAHIPNTGSIQFDVEDNKLLQPIHSLLEQGIPIEELFQVVEMKAIEWRYLSPAMASNLKPSVIFGSKYSEYRVFIEKFKGEYLQWFVCNKDSSDFYIPMDGPWNKE